MGSIILIVLVALANTPIYLLLSCDRPPGQMASIASIFAFLFAVAISLLTNAKMYAVVTATAAYCSVLIIFMATLQQRHLLQRSSAGTELNLLTTKSLTSIYELLQRLWPDSASSYLFFTLFFIFSALYMRRGSQNQKSG